MQYRTIIAPVISTLAVAAQLVFGVEIPEDLVNQTIVVLGNAVLIGTTLYGIFKNHKKGA